VAALEKVAVMLSPFFSPVNRAAESRVRITIERRSHWLRVAANGAGAR